MIGGRGVTLDGGVYDIALYVEGLPTAGEVVLRFLAGRLLTIPPNLLGSVASAGIAPTGSVAFTLAQNGSTLGTITFAAGVTAGVMPTLTAIQIAVGDVITLTAPGSQDATMANLSFTLSFVR
jgi:hypothetical protein